MIITINLLLTILIIFMMLIYFLDKKYVFKSIRIWTWRKKTITLSEYEEFISNLSLLLTHLSKNSVGALIVVEKFQKLQKYINLGYVVNSKFIPEFLFNIFFNKSSAMHDGGVIIRDLNVISVSSYFPITASKITTNFGSRHRAAIGISEQTDSIALVVSETTGKISFAKQGKIILFEKNNLIDLSVELFKLFHYYIS